MALLPMVCFLSVHNKTYHNLYRNILKMNLHVSQRCTLHILTRMWASVIYIFNISIKPWLVCCTHYSLVFMFSIRNSIIFVRVISQICVASYGIACHDKTFSPLSAQRPRGPAYYAHKNKKCTVNEKLCFRKLYSLIFVKPHRDNGDDTHGPPATQM